MALTDTKIKNAKLPNNKTQLKLTDTGSLYLLLKGKGKYWRFNYVYAGKQNTAALGVYPTVSLKEARQKRNEIKLLLDKGTDPNQHKKKFKQAALDTYKQNKLKDTKDKNTFEVIAYEWLSVRKIEWSASYYSKTCNRLKNHIFPEIGSTPINQITKAQISNLIEKIGKQGILDTAHRAGRLTRNILEYASDKELIELVPMGHTKNILATYKSKPMPTITKPSEIGQLLLDIDLYNGHFLTLQALKLLPHLAVRSEEFRTAEWSEFNFKEKIWTIPAAHRKLPKNMKSEPSNTHIVPLSRQVIKILKELKNLSHSEKLLFPSTRTPNKAMSENTINNALEKLGYKNKIVGHGFRAMFSTIMNAQEYNPDAIERQLAHKERNAIRAAYNRADYMKDRIKMMQDWADYLWQLKKEAILKLAEKTA